MGGPIWPFFFFSVIFPLLGMFGGKQYQNYGRLPFPRLALPTEKPDLLKFVLNVKQGIREPSSPKPNGNGQKSSIASPGSGGLLPGFKAISIGNVGLGQSKSANSQSSQTGRIVQSGQPSSGQYKAPSLPGGQNNGIAGQAAQNKPITPAPIQAPPMPLQQAVVPPSIPKSVGEDPYGLEIAVTVGTTTSIRNASPSTITTTAGTTSTTKMPSCGPDVLFVLDSTGSVRLVYNDQRNYILDVAKQMDIGPAGQHVGLILYSSRLKQRIVVGLDQPQGKEQFLQTVRELPYHGGITATGNALILAAKALAKRRPNKRTLVVVLTDGFTYDEWENPSKELQSFGPGVDVIVAGDVEKYSRPVLDKIAGDPSRVLLGEENKSKALDYLRCR